MFVFNNKAIREDRYSGNGYFAGTGDGKVTVNGQPAAREITCLNADTLEVVRRVWSFPNGHYLIPNLSSDYRYLLIARDYKREFDPFGYDYRSPAEKLSADEQKALVSQWQ